jgi:hypothetical protein
MRGERTFKVRERAFSALTKQYAVEFFDPFWTTSIMYNVNLLSMFGLWDNMVGDAFRFRNDISLKMGGIMTKILNFAKDGGEVMIKHNWMEEPPQAVDRKVLAKIK